MAPLAAAVLLLFHPLPSGALSGAYGNRIYDPGPLKPTDSTPRVCLGDTAPDFTLPSLSGETVTLSRFRGSKNVLLTFIPAAWTPVCSDQWPGYNLARPLFEANDTVVLGISVDSLATLHAWTREMGDLWFPVLSDFWPHGRVADSFGILRGDGMAERAILIVDKQGVIRYFHVGDINTRPDLGRIIKALESANTAAP
jgi:peroxiredoxin (alkyl hydroperoxide reductase subunit C)